MHRASRCRGLLVHQRLGGLGLGQHGVRMGQQCMARVGQRKPARGAMKQPYTQPFLQLADPPAEFGLGHAQRPAGRRKTAMVGHGGEISEVVEVLHGGR